MARNRESTFELLSNMAKQKGYRLRYRYDGLVHHKAFEGNKNMWLLISDDYLKEFPTSHEDLIAVREVLLKKVNKSASAEHVS